MTNLPLDIKIRFYEILRNRALLSEFEEWVYEAKDLEKIISKDDYLDLISLNYNKSGAYYELCKLLKTHIDIGEFEAYKLIELLEEAKLRNDNLPYILMEFYDLYCKGYSFLNDLGLGYGLCVDRPQIGNSSYESWDDVPEKDKKKYINNLYPEFGEEVERVLSWINTKKIVLSGIQDGNRLNEYKDYRNEEEKKSKMWYQTAEDKTRNASISRNKLWDKLAKRKWWKFWE